MPRDTVAIPPPGPRTIALSIELAADARARRRGLLRIVSVTTPIGTVKMRAWQARQYRSLCGSMAPAAALERVRQAGTTRRVAPWFERPATFETPAGRVVDLFGCISRNRWMRSRYGDRLSHGRVNVFVEPPPAPPRPPVVQLPSPAAPTYSMEALLSPGEDVPADAGVARMHRIRQALADFIEEPLEVAIGNQRARRIARPRQMAMWLARHHTTLSLPHIGRFFSRRDHTTVMHGIRAVSERLKDPAQQEHETFVMRMIAAAAGIDLEARLVPQDPAAEETPLLRIVLALAAYLREPAEMVGTARRCIAAARQSALWLARHEARASFPVIGRAFGNLHHSTVQAAVTAVQTRLCEPATAEAEARRIRAIAGLAGLEPRSSEVLDAA